MKCQSCFLNSNTVTLKEVRKINWNNVCNICLKMRGTENQNAAFGFSIYKNLKNGVIKELFSFTKQDILPEA